MKVDKDTLEVINEQKPLSQMVKSDGWKEARAMLDVMLTDMMSVMNIDTLDEGAVIVEIGARKLARTIILDWVSEVEGKAEQYQLNTPEKPKKQAEFIKEFE